MLKRKLIPTSLRFIWLFFLLISVAFLALSFNSEKIETSLLKLLPKYQQSSTQNALEQVAKKFNDKLIIAVSHRDQAKAREQLQEVNAIFQQSKLFLKAESALNLNPIESIYKQLVPYQYQLLMPIDREVLNSKAGTETIIQQATAQLYSLASISEAQFTQDPLFLMRNYIGSLVNLQGQNLLLDGDLFYSQHHSKYYYFTFLTLSQSAFLPEYQQSVQQLLHSTKQQFDSEHEMFSFGSILYAGEAFQQAKDEISTVGLGGLFGIIILFLFIFRSLTPLFLSLFTIVTAIIVAFNLSILVFGQIYMFTLIFGSTVIGVAIDYCFHYFIESTQVRGKENVIRRIFPGLTLGLLSSALAYLSFIFGGLTVLVQIALFSVTGLFCAYLSVLLLFPFFYPNKVKSNKSLVVLSTLGSAIIDNYIARKIAKPMPLLFFISILVVGAVWFLHPDDDVRKLQRLSPHLKIDEQQIRQALGQLYHQQYLLVTDKDINSLLEHEGHILTDFKQYIGADYIALNTFLPTLLNQQNNLIAYKKLAKSAAFKKYFTNLGLTDLQQNFSRQLGKTSLKAINYQSLLSTPEFKNLLSNKLIALNEGGWAIIIPLKDQAIINQALPNGVQLVNQAKDMSTLFMQFRQQTTQSLVIVALLLLVLGIYRYGLRNGLYLISLPMISGLLSLLTVSFLGHDISLFNVLAILLLLGMSLDYMIFLLESTHPRQTIIALLLSCSTTILSFGLLSLSNVEVIASFGLTVAIGISVILFISPAIILGVRQ